ncbi:hypothetical protein SCATT_55460 [Streptantibioticus cattleyicolor NRRL 8057 = DSM 46488]|uniref:Uncharacterized protein n=1 Tax=Streptantibioticus cattleyicolor (strain ATCC 35852 / DSM 46488 / JCM 4925 / NBRC 14057 / NRRL 8057) TaxID=1003195 RepID=G8X149_STREN|nr:hypothetical protein SCATT_55460 [Streptantibioticus cattleyicolor NRRL 8057 = DSM 46488]
MSTISSRADEDNGRRFMSTSCLSRSYGNRVMRGVSFAPSISPRSTARRVTDSISDHRCSIRDARSSAGVVPVSSK